MAALICVAAGAAQTATAFFLLWLAQYIYFVLKRLANTCRKPYHVAEMLVTSALIPFLSLYWSWYGAYRYKVFYV
jgi:putative effector of murein hydrolase